MTELLHADGFLGTNGNWAADFTLVMMILVGVTLTTGAVLARMEKFQAHMVVQTLGVLVNLVFVLWLMVLPFRDFIVRDLGGPRIPIFYVITTLHAVLGFTALIFGLFVVLRGWGLMIKPLRFNKYKPFMRAAYSFYMLAILAGITVYLVWFTVLPAGQVPVYE